LQTLENVVAIICGSFKIYFPINSPNSLHAKKAKGECPRHLHQTTFETYNKPSFEIAYYSENVVNLLNQNVAQNVAISLGYFIFSKIIMSLQK
jgi:hypothetical protein